MKRAVLLASAVIALAAAPAQAGEVFGGVMAHAVNTPFTFDIPEKGVDIQIGYRGEKSETLSFIGKPSPHIFASINTRGDTNFVAIGLSWKLGKTIYFRPGLGLALHDGPIPRGRPGQLRTDLGSRVLFEPELGLGYQINEKVSVEANWTHISNAQLLSGQNPGIDMIGIRAAYKF